MHRCVPIFTDMYRYVPLSYLFLKSLREGLSNERVYVGAGRTISHDFGRKARDCVLGLYIPIWDNISPYMG